MRLRSRSQFCRPCCLGDRPVGVVLAAAVMVALAASVTAQAQFAELDTRGVSPGFAGASAVGDVDGDGDSDVVIAGANARLRLLQNDGAGGFAEAPPIPLPANNGTVGSLALGDVDGDGDLDLVVGNTHTPNLGGLTVQNRLFLNDGSGSFTDVTALRMPVDGDPTRAVVLGDVDGDGDLDLLIGNETFFSQYTYAYGEQNRLYLNNGAGTFVDATAARLPVTYDITASLALGDVDGDGDLDLVVGNWTDFIGPASPQNLLYLNDGTGTFTDATATQMPVDINTTLSVALGDVDGDGDLDLVVGNGYSEQNRLYLNNGTGTFADVTAAQMPVQQAFGAIGLALRDVDGDGDLDLAIANLTGRRLYANNGAGLFTDVTATRLPAANGPWRSVAAADVDGDGDADLIGGGNDVSLYENDGAGTFTFTITGMALTRLPMLLAGAQSMAGGDVDGDGDLDLVASSPTATALCRNDGTGRFVDVTASQLPVGVPGARTLALADVDADGDLDLVLATSGQERLYLNNGSGTFTDATAASMPVVADSTYSIASGDVDGDGDVDLVTGNQYQPNRLYTNNGAGVFVDVTAAQLPPDFDATRALVLGDVDGDGDLDLISGNEGAGGQNRLYLNNGAGTFTDATAASMPVHVQNTLGLAIGDVDGDGDLDLVEGNAGQDRLLLNDGTGTFTDATASRMPVDSTGTTSVALGDVDVDGDLDLVIGNSLQQNRYYLNDGTGRFTDATARMPDQVYGTSSMLLLDVDGDGDLDQLVGSALPDHHLYLNLLRQLDAPRLLRPGNVYQLDVYARHGQRHLLDVALPYSSPATAHIPIPGLGLLGIDPYSMTALPPFRVRQPAGVGSLLLSIPDLPVLVGIALHTQVLLIQYPNLDHLTNVYPDVFLN